MAASDFSLPPTISGMSFGPTGASVLATSGASCSISAQNIMAFQATLHGPCTLLNRNVVERWIATTIADAIGWSNIDPSRIVVRYDATNGAVTWLELF